jgi:hypothetical protein
MNRWIAASTLLILALVFTACASKSSDTGAGAPATQAAATTAPTPTAAPTPTPAPTANPDQALIDLLRGGKAGAYKVTYTFSMAGGTTTTNQTGTLTQTVKSPLLRQDVTLTVGGQTQTISTFVKPDGIFTCGAFISGSAACFNFSGALGGAIGGAAAAAPQGPTGIPSDLSGWNLVPTSSKNVAGQDTRCFTFTGASSAATTGATAGQTLSGTGCFTTQGIPLYISTKTGTISAEMTATSFSTTVTDADFALPYPVQQIPGRP